MNYSAHTKRKRLSPMDNFSEVLVNATELKKGRLYFVSLNTDVKPKSTPSVHYFTVDSELQYEHFYKDFGPLNLSLLYHYCMKLGKKLSNHTLLDKKIVHFTGPDDKKRANAAYLIGCYAIIYLDYDADKAYDILTKDTKKPYLDFRDASCGEAYTVSLLNCLKAIKKALTFNFFNFDNFDFLEYEHYERVEHGDLNWIVPNKFIAFCGPHNKSKIDKGYQVHSPDTYFGYFRRSGVSTIVRLNKKVYDANKFVAAGFQHKDLFFVDGGTPNDRIMEQFLKLAEEASGALAVHCKAGLGRTGTLIACYIMKHYKFTADEAIAWIRICRPGSVIGHQQTWLHEKQQQLWSMGEAYRKSKGIRSLHKHSVAIYSISTHDKKRNSDNMTGIMKKVDLMEINDPDDDYRFEDHKLTQGDRLNEIKSQRTKSKSLVSNLAEPRFFRTKIQLSSVSTPVLRNSKFLTSPVRVSNSTTRILTKRYEMNESHSKRKCAPTLSSTPIEKVKITAPVKGMKKKENYIEWLPTSRTQMTESESKLIIKSVKRGKRSLNAEKEKVSSRSVKLLKRSYWNCSTEVQKCDGKLRLPAVKVNKTV